MEEPSKCGLFRSVAVADTLPLVASDAVAVATTLSRGTHALSPRCGCTAARSCRMVALSYLQNLSDFLFFKFTPPRCHGGLARVNVCYRVDETSLCSCKHFQVQVDGSDFSDVTEIKVFHWPDASCNSDDINLLNDAARKAGRNLFIDIIS